MVLISIHPFAVRRLFLLVLALAGFSALCFADPVLMARRYNPDRSRVAASAPSMPTLRLNLTEAIEQNHAWNATIALEKGQNPGLGASSLCFGIQAWNLQPKRPTANTSLLPEPTTTN